MSAVMPPIAPPMSCQCAMHEEKPSSSPSQKIGTENVMWFRWLPVR